MRRGIGEIRITDSEVEETYQKAKDRFSGILVAEAKYRIRRTLEDKRRAEGLRQTLETLRKKARIRNYLLETAAANLNLHLDESPSRGKANAPVIVAVFSDFECPYCRKDQRLLKGVLEKWPEQVRLVLKHFPLPQHPNAFQVAVASVCADKQGRFWEFHDRAFEGGQDLSPAGLVAIASSLDLDTDEFRKCLASAGAKERVEKDIRTAAAAGVSGTPTYFVNNRRIPASAELERTIEEMLQGRGGLGPPVGVLRTREPGGLPYR